MEFLPNLSLTFLNGFWGSLLFIVTNLVMIKIYPSHFKQRLLSMPKFQSTIRKVSGAINFLLFQGLIVFVFFIPIQSHSALFFPGLVIFLSGYVLYTMSLIDYATTNPDEPVTKGIYRYSRNPQQIMTIVMWIGIGMVLNCGLIITLALLQLITSFPTFISQEKYCVEKYGAAFKKYMTKAPRYLTLFPNKQLKLIPIMITLLALLSLYASDLFSG